MDPLPPLLYTKLTDSDQEFRVLRILPALASDDQIQCELQLVRLDESPVYDCLSYAWGDLRETKQILIDGHAFEATENLVVALHQLRAHKHPKYHRNELIWIDAICINQKDNDEKSHQVQMMRDIYSNAVQVIVWLGKATPESTTALQSITKLMDNCPSFEDDPRVVRLSDWFIPRQHLFDVFSEFQQQDFDFDGQLLTGIGDVYNRPWWTRIWVIQEVVVSKLTWVLCGSDALGFHYLSHFFGYCHNLASLPVREKSAQWHSMGLQLVSRMPTIQIFDMPWKHRKIDLLLALSLVTIERLFDATDPRDRIYALLGLLKEPYRMQTQVDYSVPWETVYRNVSCAMLENLGLKVLSYCAGSTPRLSKSLPSWVPDWTSPIKPSPLGIDNPDKLYSTSGDSSPSGDFSGSDGRITIAGFEVSTIQEIGLTIENSVVDVKSQKPASNADPGIRSWLQSICDLLSRSGVSGPEQTESLMRIASADVYKTTNGDVERLQEEGTNSFTAFYELLHKPTDRSSPESPRLRATALGYRSSMLSAGLSRRPFLSSDNRVGLAPESAAVGDVISVFYGSDVPFVLRLDGDGRYRLLGEAYVHGIMDGELMTGDVKPKSEIFTLC